LFTLDKAKFLPVRNNFCPRSCCRYYGCWNVGM